jgi:nucleotide-binding universal stress UspA family protein
VEVAMLEDSPDLAHRPLRKILVATDFSAASARARDYALALAAPGAQLTFVHAHPLPLPDRPEPAYVPDWMPDGPSVREEALERLEEFEAPARAAGLCVESVLQEGLPAEVILAQAAALRPDLIALGTHGRQSFERLVMGSTAERVVRLAQVPVLTVSAKDGAGAPRLREILCAVGLDQGSATLAFASELARRTGCALSVLHVLETALGQTPEDWLERRAHERLSEALRDAGGLPGQPLVRSGRPSREILKAARERRVDVIVMGVHDACAPELGFIGSTANQIVRQAGCGVITVRSLVARESEEREAGLVGAGRKP